MIPLHLVKNIDHHHRHHIQCIPLIENYDQGLRKEEKCIPLIENYDQGPRKEKMRQAIPIKEV